MSDFSFHVWCDDSAKLDAFIAAASTLLSQEQYDKVEVSTPGRPSLVSCRDVPASEAVATVRALWTARSRAEIWLNGHLPHQGWFLLRLECFGEDLEPRWIPNYVLGGDLVLWPQLDDRVRLRVANIDGKRSQSAEAVIFGRPGAAITEHVLHKLCVPDDNDRVTTGGLSGWNRWYAPLEIAGTYNLDGNIVRDVALSWMYIHEGARIEHIAGLSMDELAAHIEATPPRTSIGIAIKRKQVWEHARIDDEAGSTKLGWPLPGYVRRGARKKLDSDVELSREEVLTILRTPPQTIIEAMEAVALPDQEWLHAESIAQEMIEAEKRGEPMVEVCWPDEKHAHYLEQHAPYHVRRLPNGGVLLATHPYRTLWPLWADALDLLGIRPKTA